MQEGWYGRLDSAFVLDQENGDDPMWSCDHVHATEEEAWSCVEAFAHDLAARVANR